MCSISLRHYGLGFRTISEKLKILKEEPQIIQKIPFSFKGSAKVAVDGVSAIVAVKIFSKKEQ